MNLTKPQLIIVAAAGVIVLVFVLIFFGVIPGLQNSSTDPTKIRATLNFWGIGDESDAYGGIFNAFKLTYPNVTINYRSFTDEDGYNSALLNALAAGQGPDIFMARNTDLLEDANKMSPVAPTQFSITQLRQLFPQVVASDFSYQNNVFALPLSVDTLALVYNRNIFDQAAIPLPASWKNWDDLIGAVPKLVKRDASGQITQAAVALGTAKNVGNASDILYLLMLQSGVTMTNNQDYRISFASDKGAQVLGFYSQFSSPNSQAYTWNNSMPDSLDAFGQGKTAMVFEYASNLPGIRSRNSFLNVEVAPVPQPQGANLSISYPSYWGYTVSRESQYQALAWNLILAMTTNDATANTYAQKTQKPPALNSLIYQYQNDPNLGVFARQALTARSWVELDRGFIDNAVSAMIDSVAGGEVSPRSALQQTQDQINQYLNRGTF
ncbi:MAG: extracellular solute-binding protein [Minisyncoccia bacterium]|jgi:ABC-type glycerol-3-phosphate transport system substrate-binding protein